MQLTSYRWCPKTALFSSNVAISSFRVALLVFVVSSLSCVSSLRAAEGDAEPQNNMAEPAPASSHTKADAQMSSMSHHSQAMARHIEERIKTLHDKLGITQTQEAAWSNVAQTMRDNEAALDARISERHKNNATMTALDDLQSYEEITQEHADGMKRLITVFQSLYSDMSDAQKKEADLAFSSYEGHGHKSDGKHM